MPTSIQTIIDNANKVQDAIEKLVKQQIMVGIPAEKGPRKDPSQPSNALLGYVHEHGVPEHNLPARPFLRPGVANANSYTIAGLRRAAKYAMEGKSSAATSQLRAIGMNAAQSVQQKITDGPFAPLSPRTIARRMAKLKGTKKLTAAQKSGGFVDIRPLIDTGQLRRSVTWVIRTRK